MFRKVKHGSSRSFDKYTGEGEADEQDESNLYRCRVCGWICNSEYVTSDAIDSSETEYQDGNTYTYTTGTADTIEDIVVSRGCPFCGTLTSKS